MTSCPDGTRQAGESSPQACAAKLRAQPRNNGSRAENALNCRVYLHNTVGFVQKQRKKVEKIWALWRAELTLHRENTRNQYNTKKSI